MASLNTPTKTRTERRDKPSQPICPNEEGFLHNHQECMKEQNMAETIQSHQHNLLMMQFGGHTDPSKKLTSPRAPSPSEPEPESPKNLEEIRGDPNLWSPPPYRTPKSPNGYADSPMNWEVPDFTMKNTP